MEHAEYFAEKARQCRRLLRATDDSRTIDSLTELAKEFDAKAESAEASTCTLAPARERCRWTLDVGQRNEPE